MKSSIQIHCPTCQQAAGSYCLKIDTYSIYKCSNCGLEYTYPMPTNDKLLSFYSNYSDIRADENITKLNASLNLKTLKKIGLNKQSKILDFGCGRGNFIEVAGDNCFAIDLIERTHPRIFQTIEQLPHKKFDCITLWGVLEHLNDIESTMSLLSSLLENNGYIVITTVNAEGIIPYYHKPPEHLTYWTKESLKILAKNIQCKIVEISDYSMFQRSDIYFNRLLSRTPNNYSKIISKYISNLPEILTVPTNELFIILKKESKVKKYV